MRFLFVFPYRETTLPETTTERHLKSRPAINRARQVSSHHPHRGQFVCTSQPLVVRACHVFPVAGGNANSRWH